MLPMALLLLLLPLSTACGEQFVELSWQEEAGSHAPLERHSNISLSLGPAALELLGLRPGWQVESVVVYPPSEPLDFDQAFQPALGGSHTLTAALPPHLPWQRIKAVSLRGRGCTAANGAAAAGPAGGGQVYPLGSGGGGSPVVAAWHSAHKPAGAAVEIVVTLDGAGCLPEGSGEASWHRAASGPGRALLQNSPSSDCALAVGPQSFQFAACTELSTSPPAPYKIFYSLSPAPGNSSSTLWRGGMRVNAAQFPGGQWAGLGFPQYPATMLGTHAVIVKECSNCPSGAKVVGCALKDYVPEANKEGSYPITDNVAAKDSDGYLVAAFTAEVAKPLDQLAGPTPADLLYAIGPLAPDGSLRPHLSMTYGGTQVQLQAAAAGGSLAPQPEGGSTSGPAPSPPVSPASAPAPAAVAAGATPAPDAQLAPVPVGPGAGAGCQLSVAGSQLSFAACTPVQGVGSNFHLFWHVLSSAEAAAVSPAPAPGRTLVRFGMNATSDGWVAVGFPATPGQMIGSTAVVLRVCSACSSGVGLLDYFLGAKDPSAVQPPGKLPISNLTASTAPGGWLQGAFEVELDAAAVSGVQFPLIFAAGMVAGPGAEPPPAGRRRLLTAYDLQQHSTYGASTVDLAAGTSSGVAGPDPKKERMKNAHAWLMVVGWGLLLPSGVLVAHSFKSLGPIWFQIHRAVQILGLSCALTAFVMIFYAVGASGTIYTLHRRLGISAMSLGLTQLSALVLRPHHNSRWRRTWNLFHHWVGRAAVLVAVANIYEGIIHVKQVGSWGVIAYTVVFSCIVGLGILKDSWDYAHLPPPALMEHAYPSAAVEREEALAGHARGRPPAHPSFDGSEAGPKRSTGSSLEALQEQA